MHQLLVCLTAAIRADLPAASVAHAVQVAGGDESGARALRMAAAARVDLDASTLATLACDRAPAVRRIAVMNPSCPTASLLRCAREEQDQEILGALAGRATPERIFDELYARFRSSPDAEHHRILLGAEHLPSRIARTALPEAIDVLWLHDPGGAGSEELGGLDMRACVLAATEALLRHRQCHEEWALTLPASWCARLLTAPATGPFSETARARLVQEALLDPLEELAFAGESVTDEIGERLYNVSDDILASQRDQVVAAIERCGVSGCDRADVLRQRYLRSEDAPRVDLERAESASDPVELAALIANPDCDSDTALAVIHNSHAPSEVAVAALRRLHSSESSRVRDQRVDDVAFMTAFMVRWPGLIGQIDSPVRQAAVRAAVLELLVSHEAAAGSVAEAFDLGDVALLPAWAVCKLTRVPVVIAHLTALLDGVDPMVLGLVGEMLEGELRTSSLKDLVEVATLAVASAPAV